MRLHRRILIVGGRGFLGSHIRVHADILDLKDGNDVIKGIFKDYDVIVFLAVDKGRTEATYAYNESLYIALDEYMQRRPNTHVIYTSSAAVYPDSPSMQTERSLVKPVNLYGYAKLLGECYIQQYKNHTIFRLSNLYGDGGVGAPDLFANGENNIWGRNNIRDYIHVEIVAHAIEQAIKHASKFQGITNICSGIGTTTQEIYEIFGTGKPKYIPYRRGDVRCSILDNTKMLELL